MGLLYLPASSLKSSSLIRSLSKCINVFYISGMDAIIIIILFSSSSSLPSLPLSTEAGVLAKTYIERGLMVPDNVMTRLLLPRLEEMTRHSWLMDGKITHTHTLLKKIKGTLKQHNVTPSQSHFGEIKLCT